MRFVKFLFIPFVLALVLSFPQSLKATPTEIEISSCKTNSTARPITNEYETFVTNYDHVTKISVYAAVWPSETLTISLLDNSDTLLLQRSLAEDGTKWYTATWGEGFNLISGNTYRIRLTATGAGSNWFYSENASCNATGSAYAGGTEISPAIDFMYIAYGYNNEPINIDPGTGGDTTGGSTTPVNTATSPTTTSNSSASAPAATTSSSIVKPSNLVAQYVAETKSVKATWGKSSTTDIDGYRVFRSEEETKGFIKAGEVKKDVLEFSDTNIVEGKKYYYFVRAYKGTAESASSETVNVTISTIATAASNSNTPAAPQPVQESSAKTNWLMMGLIAVAVLLLAFWLAYRFWWLKRKAKSPIA